MDGTGLVQAITVQEPNTPDNLVWVMIGGFLLIAFLIWVVRQISKNFWVVVALGAVFLLVIVFSQSGSGT